MKIRVNGEWRTLNDVRTVHDLIRAVGLSGRPVAVEVNRQLVPRKDHDHTPLSEGDLVEIVTLVGGG